MSPLEHTVIADGDLDHDFYLSALDSGTVAWDIETSGLDWLQDKIGTCQVATLHGISVVQLQDGHVPKRLASLLESAEVEKVFHHAPFDLRFMVAHWQVEPRNVACTKIASKILNPELSASDHSLMPVIGRHLDIAISKDQQRSDWMSSRLTREQIEYAASDVAHLLALSRALTAKCRAAGLGGFLASSWEYLPTRVALDLRGSGDVFSY